MSILINKDTKVITQGITGKTGQFHTRACREYGNGEAAFVAGVHPKRAGENFEGIISACKAVNLDVPLVVRMKGTNEELGKKMLADSGLPIISADTMADAATLVVAAAK